MLIKLCNTIACIVWIFEKALILENNPRSITIVMLKKNLVLQIESKKVNEINFHFIKIHLQDASSHYFETI